MTRVKGAEREVTHFLPCQQQVRTRRNCAALLQIVCCAFAAVLLLVSLGGCTKRGDTTASQSVTSRAERLPGSKLKVVASSFGEYDLVRAIAGDRVDLTMLISPGASLHSFDPTPAQIRTVQQADMFVYVGGESDVWADNLLASLNTSRMTIIRLIDSIDALPEETAAPADESEQDYDEHLWTSPKNTLVLTGVIRDALCAADNANAAFYRENTVSYQIELKKLDEDISSVVAGAQRRTIVVADKFPFLYLVKHYGLDYVAAFSACNDQTDASAQTIAYLIDTVKRKHIPYLYYVELSNQNVARTVSEQTGAGMLLLHSCHNVTKAEFEHGATYLSLMRENIINLKKGLG